jgi:hypothetical protein
LRRQVRQTELVNLRFEIGCLLEKDGGKVGVFGRLGESEQRRRLTLKIVPAKHGTFPMAIDPKTSPEPGFRSVRNPQN